jgi:hypothetical protein
MDPVDPTESTFAKYLLHLILIQYHIARLPDFRHGVLGIGASYFGISLGRVPA